MSAPPPQTDPRAPSALPEGTRLGEFEIRDVVGVGGFGIVYRAFDHTLEREVAIKEYMPQSMCSRTLTLHVSLRTESEGDAFATGLRSFVAEARMLAHFNHPSLLKVHRFWEANGTAYMAMPLYRGRTLKELAQNRRNPPNDAWVRKLLTHLAGALELLHAEGTYHRDIAPDNILIGDDGRPVLLDFGAARRALADRTQAFTAILKPSFAPIEQYAETSAVKQGPWTDLYALGATLHYLLTGEPPPPSTARALHDEMRPLAERYVSGVSRPLLEIIDWMLAPAPADRLPSVAVLRDALAGRVLPPSSKGDVTIPLHRRSGEPTPTPAGPPEPAPSPDRAADRPKDAARRSSSRPQTPAARPPLSRRTGLLIGIGAGFVLALALTWWASRGSGPAPSRVTASSASAGAPTSAPMAASAVPAASASEAAPAATPASMPMAGPASSASSPPAAPASASASAAKAPARGQASGAGRPGGSQAARPGASAASNPRPWLTVDAAPATSASRDAQGGSAAGAAPGAPREPSSRSAAPAPGAVAPNARCGGLNLFAQFNCMRQACGTEPPSQHPDCVAWRALARNPEN